ncbi:MAG TPA: phosphoribosyltransferase family protein [Candidatus Acidoferrales bacterium]|nr:phosphoribosyltransferase family protein [Candidatus Acidoferrales bacterium]
MRAGPKVVYSRTRVAARVASLGRSISRDYAGRTVDIVVILENAFVFAADLVRRISRPMVCHFVRTETREFKLDGRDQREVFFSRHPDLRERHVLLVDAVLRTGVTQDFLVRRLMESRPRSLRMAVLVDKPQDRRVNLKPDYFGFSAASKYLVGYGLAGDRGTYRNLPYVGVLHNAARRGAGSTPRSGPRPRRVR